jgi:DNA (cytosine-5)-methyltransferase 1
VSHAYYNEIDPHAAQWLRELIRQGHIADGEVDERSIVDVIPSDLRTFTQCHFFAGIGVWSHALRQAGWPDDRPVWTGSCPCQPFSAAGKGDGFDDERHLWPAFHWLIEQCDPDVIFGEQVAKKAGETWLDLVSTDLENTGFTFGAGITTASSFGAPHIRQRTYWLAHAECEGRQGGLRGWQNQKEKMVEGHPRCGGSTYHSPWENVEWHEFKDGKSSPTEPGTCPLVDGAPARVGRLRGYGNAIVAQQAQAFIEAYLEVTR